MMNNRAITSHRQQGMTFIGWMAVAALAGLLIVSFFRILPMYMEYLTVQSVLEGVKTDDKIDPRSKGDIWEAIQKRLYINDVSSVKRENLTVVRKDGKTTVTITYETQRPYIANLYIGGHFSESVVIDR